MRFLRINGGPRIPRCLDAFQLRTESEAIQSTRSVFGEEWTLFELVPPTPDQSPILLGSYLNKLWPTEMQDCLRGPILVSPLAIRWEPSGEVVELFDGTRHGYNAEHGLGSVHAQGQTERMEYQWPVWPCENPVFIVCLSYTFYDRMDEELIRPEDFFESFALAAWSRSDREVRCITEFECA